MVRDSIKAAVGKLGKPFEQYAQMQNAYEEAFNIEKETYDIKEMLDQDPEEFGLEELDTRLRYLGDRIQAVKDDDIEEINEELTEYGGEGGQGALFTVLSILGKHDAAATVIGEDAEEVRETVEPKLREYFELKEQRYGLDDTQHDELTEKVSDGLEDAINILEPLADVYHNDGDVVDYIHVLEEAGENIIEYGRAKDVEEKEKLLQELAEREEELEKKLNEEGVKGSEVSIMTDSPHIQVIGSLASEALGHSPEKFIANSDSMYDRYQKVVEIADNIEDQEAYRTALEDENLEAAAAETPFETEEFKEKFERAHTAVDMLKWRAQFEVPDEEIGRLESELDRLYGETA